MVYNKASEEKKWRKSGNKRRTNIKGKWND